MADMARLHTYIRPPKLAYVDAMMGAVAYHRNKKSQGLQLAVSCYRLSDGLNSRYALESSRSLGVNFNNLKDRKRPEALIRKARRKGQA